jgi:hypothetical protein
MRPLLPLLTDRRIEVRSPAGRSYSVPLLPAAMHDHVMTAGASLAGLTPCETVRARAALREIIRTVWPPEHAADLLYLSADNTFAVATRLLFGDLPDERPSESGDAPASDFEFVCAKVMAAFPGYTIAVLLSEPIPVIVQLFRLASRLDAWNAMHRDFPALVAAQHGGRAAKALEAEARRAIQQQNRPPAAEAYTEEDFRQSVANIEKARHLAPREVVAWQG